MSFCLNAGRIQDAVLLIRDGRTHLVVELAGVLGFNFTVVVDIGMSEDSLDRQNR